MSVLKSQTLEIFRYLEYSASWRKVKNKKDRRINANDYQGKEASKSRILRDLFIIASALPTSETYYIINIQDIKKFPNHVENKNKSFFRLFSKQTGPRDKGKCEP
jgi:hypothetical protein